MLERLGSLVCAAHTPSHSEADSGLAQASKYEETLLSHTGELASVESSIRSLSYFLPGRFRDAELASEALFAGTNLLSSYHDSILIQAAARKLPASDRPKASSHARYTASWRDTSTLYASAAKMLRLLSYTELLLEMVAHKKLGRRGTGRVIVWIETIKALCRLVIFNNTQYRPVVDPPLPQREVDPALFQQQQSGTTSKTWTGSRTGRSYPSIASLSTPSSDAARFSTTSRQPSNAAVQGLLGKSALFVQDFKQPQQLLAKLEALPDQWNEVLYILRPLIYVLALQKWGRKAITPFTLSFILEYLTVKTTLSRGGNRASDLESQEQGRRQMDLLKYLLRGPVWHGFTKPRIASIASGVERVPLLGIAGTVVKDYLELYERYIYYVGP